MCPRLSWAHFFSSTARSRHDLCHWSSATKSTGRKAGLSRRVATTRLHRCSTRRTTSSLDSMLEPCHKTNDFAKCASCLSKQSLSRANQRLGKVCFDSGKLTETKNFPLPSLHTSRLPVYGSSSSRSGDSLRIQGLRLPVNHAQMQRGAVSTLAMRTAMKGGASARACTQALSSLRSIVDSIASYLQR